MNTDTLKTRYTEDSITRMAHLISISIYGQKVIYVFDNQRNMRKLTNAYVIGETYLLTDNMCLFIQRGEVVLKVNNKEITVSAHGLCVIPDKSKLELVRVDSDTKFICIRVTRMAHERSFKDLGLYNNKTVGNEAISKQLCDVEFEAFMELYSNMGADLGRGNDNQSGVIARAYCNLFYILILNLFRIETKMKTNVENDNPSRQEFVFRNFIELLNEYSNTEREVQFYADKLNITSKYLSSVTNLYSGKSAGRWIAEYVVETAKKLMRENNCKVQDVSEILHFNSQSFFGRYFKRIAGISPKRYMTLNEVK